MDLSATTVVVSAETPDVTARMTVGMARTRGDVREEHVLRMSLAVITASVSMGTTSAMEKTIVEMVRTKRLTAQSPLVQRIPSRAIRAVFR